MSRSSGAIPQFQRATRLASFGHSFAADLGASSATQGWSHKLARALGAEHVHYGHSGAAVAVDDGSGTNPNAPGGYATVLNGLRPTTVPGTDRTSAPYLPMADVVAFDFGANDLWATHTNPATSAALVRTAMRAAICRARAGGLFENTHASVAYGTGWSAATNSQTSSAGYEYTSTNGSTFTITAPADFPGGEIDLGFLVWNGGTAVWTIVVDGGAPQTLDLTAVPVPSSGKLSSYVYRLLGLAPGTHSIVCTVNSITGFGVFDYWQIASPVVPVVLVINQPHHDIAGGWVTSGTAGFQHSPVLNTDIDGLNAQLATLVGEFDSAVALVDAATAFGSSPPINGQPHSPFSSDNLHPNDYGHILIAQTALQALRGASYTPASIPDRVQWRLVQPNGSVALPNGAEPMFAAGWSGVGSGFGGSTGGKFCKTRDGRVHIRLGVKSAAQPPTTTTLFTLPEGYWPADNTEHPAVAGNGATVGSIEIDAGGNVIWMSGTVTGSFCAEISFPCDE